MPFQKIENVLDDELFEYTNKTANEILQSESNILSTNRSWGFSIRKDSFPVLVHNIDTRTDLHHELLRAVVTKTGYYPSENLMIYYWTRFSYIPWHDDKIIEPDNTERARAALTIYLNKTWHPDNGGYFLYEDNEEIKAILPKPNLGILQYGGGFHCTTPVNFDGDIRITIQAFFDKKVSI